MADSPFPGRCHRAAESAPPPHGRGNYTNGQALMQAPGEGWLEWTRGTHRGVALLAGKEYGSGSSRDWAAKGPLLLGVRAAIAESYERIHRSNLVGMGILPLQFKSGQNAQSLGLTGRETYDVLGI